MRRTMITGLAILLLIYIICGCSAPMLTNRIVSDGRISIEVNDVQRTDHYPSDMGDISKLPPIQSGDDLVVIHLTISKIEKGHIPYFGDRYLIPTGTGAFRYTSSSAGDSVFDEDFQGQTTMLLDSTGKQYYGLSYTQGIVKGDGISGHTEFLEGTKFMYAFEFPREIKPLKLVFVYPFKQSLSSIVEWYSLNL